MSLRSIALGAVVALCAQFTSANAATLVESGGKLIGANEINIGGTLYDVLFMDTTCAAVFGSCTAGSFDFTTQGSAALAAQALLDQVLLGTYDTSPSLTFGCTTTQCNIVIPYAIPFAGTGMAAIALNKIINTDDAVTFSSFPVSIDLSGAPGKVFAKFSLSTIATAPVPPALPLLATGLAGLAVAGWRRARRARGG